MVKGAGKKKEPKSEDYDWSGKKADKGMDELNRKLDRAREATDRGHRGL